MDNISHSVIGLGVGELVQRSLAPEADPGQQRTRHRLLLLTCWMASNLPDLDLVLTPLLPAPLGYLLHHRGHTHTVLLALPQALLLFAALWLLWPAARALLRASANARRGLGAALVLGFGLHLSLDYLNSYGLHPFYPIDARWFYGDMLFIVEPVFWVAFGVPMALTLRGRASKALALTALAGALGFFAARGYLGWGALTALAAGGVGLGLLQRRAGAQGRAALALAMLLSLGFVALQGAASAFGRQRIEAVLQRLDPAARVLDVALTAFPAQPLCWNFVSVESNEGADNYRLRRGIFSLAPGVMTPAQCPAALNATGTVATASAPGTAEPVTVTQTVIKQAIVALVAAPPAATPVATTPAGAPDAPTSRAAPVATMPGGAMPGLTMPGSTTPLAAPALMLLAEAQGSLSTLRRLSSEDCYFEAWLRFARAPILDAGAATDLRFASSARGNFTTLDLSRFKQHACPLDVPGWRHPRADLLTPPAAPGRSGP